MVQLRNRLVATGAIVAVMGFGLVGGRDVVAQDATPEAGASPAAGMMAGYPNHFHSGTCDNLGEVVVPLADLQLRDASMGMGMAGAAGTPMASPMAGMMAGAPIPVAVGVTEVPLAVEDIVAGGHALNVHDPADISIYVACGNVNGAVDDQGNLFIGLEELNGSGMSGIAWLLDDGAGNTTVTVFLANFAGGEMGDMGAMATPEA